MKEDEVGRDKRRESAEKQKSTMDLKKKNEKKKSLERQALEIRRSKSRQRGEPEEESPDEDDGSDGDDDSDDSVGMASRLDRILEATPTPRGWEHQRRGQVGLLRGNRGSRPLAAPVLTPLPRMRKVGPSRAPNLPLRQRRATGLSPM